MCRIGRLAVAFGLAALVACSGGGDSSNGGGNRRNRSTDEPQELSADDPGCEFIVAGTDGRSTPSPREDVAYLTNAFAEPTVCYDKVTFELDPGDGPDLPPAYTVEYREPPFDLVKPDGKPVSTSTAGFDEAQAVLYVELSPASTTDLRPGSQLRCAGGTSTYCGNLRLRLEGMEHVVIVEWIQTLPEEEAGAVTTTTAPGAAPVPERVVWLIGLDERRPFTVDFVNSTTEPDGTVLGPRVNVLIM